MKIVSYWYKVNDRNGHELYTFLKVGEGLYVVKFNGINWSFDNEKEAKDYVRLIEKTRTKGEERSVLHI